MGPNSSSPNRGAKSRLTAQHVLAWSVHLLTASGAIWGLLAIQATWRGAWREAFGWLLVAVVVDAIDGPLARCVRAKQVLPHFDGTLLDNMIDYLNYVIVPGLMLLRGDWLPAECKFPIAASICLASAYQFCRTDAKTDDGYFTGFPSYWNIAVFYLLVLEQSPAVNLAILLGLISLVFIPVRYLYPNRTVPFRRLTLALTCFWMLLVMFILWQLPEPPRWAVWASLVYAAYYTAMSIYLTCRRSG